jgi:cytochrome c biogenesis protein
VENYPEEGKKVLGFLSYDLLYFLQFDHIYTAPYFLGLLALLAASLAACTTTTQWPTARAANRWRFKRAAPAFERLDVARRLPAAAVRDVAAALAARGYRVFLRGGAAYAFKGLAGRLGPIGVHASMLAVMAGITVGALGGYSGTAMIPVGSAAPVAGLLRPASPAARLPVGGGAALRVDAFRIDYRDDGSVRQFFSDVAVEDAAGRTLAAKTVSVNQPLRFGGVTAYQTDWSVAAVRVRVAGGGFVGDSDGDAGANGGDTSAAAGAASAAAAAPGRALALPCASLEGQPGVAGKLYAAFLPLAAPDAPGAAPRGLSFLARDLQTVTVYDAAGAFAGVRRPGSGKPLIVDGVTVVIESLTGATGLELKHDPGVPLVYLGFGGMCVTTVVSYLSHSQVWAAQAGGDVLVGGRSNRAKFGFERELDAALDGVPEAAAAAAGPPAA